MSRRTRLLLLELLQVLRRQLTWRRRERGKAPQGQGGGGGHAGPEAGGPKWHLLCRAPSLGSSNTQPGG